MDLVFTPAEVLAVGLKRGVTGQIAGDGESNWLEGVQLLAVYIILGIVFFFLPDTSDAEARTTLISESIRSRRSPILSGCRISRRIRRFCIGLTKLHGEIVLPEGGSSAADVITMGGQRGHTSMR